MHPLLLLFLAMFWMGSASAQAPDIAWQRCYGGSLTESGRGLVRTDDGGYVLVGFAGSDDGDVTFNHGDHDVWVVKVAVDGAIQWEETFGGSEQDQAHDIQQTADGGYIIAGFTYSDDGDVTGYHGQEDAWVLKISATGVLEWQNALGGSEMDWASSIQQTTDGGYVVGGCSHSVDGDCTDTNGELDFWIVQLDASGVLIWQHSYGGAGADYGLSVQQTTDGGFVMAGSVDTDSNNGDVVGHHGLSDGWVIKLDPSGLLQWQRPLGGSSGDAMSDVRQTTDGGYAVFGSSGSTDGDATFTQGQSDFWLVKLDASGTLIWQTSAGGSYSDYGDGMRLTLDGGYIACGRSYSSNDGDHPVNHGGYDEWVVKFDASGVLQWQRSLGGTQDEGIYSSVREVNADSILVISTSMSNDVDVSGNHGWTDLWVVQLSSSGMAVAEGEPEHFSLAPNPAHQEAIVSTSTFMMNTTIVLMDVTGRIVSSSPVNEHEHRLDLGTVPPGPYVVHLFSDAGTLAQRLIVQ